MHGDQHHDIPVHHVLNGWRRPSSCLRPDPSAATQLLNRFCDWWPTEDDFTRRMALGGIVLPRTFAALAVLRRSGERDEIERGTLPILLLQQSFVPSPEGWELWLQRRAMLLFYDRLGIGPLLTQYACPLRPALFLYLAIMRDLRTAERTLLAGLARDHGEDWDSRGVVDELQIGNARRRNKH
jgi:hypothetical protein